MSMYVRKTVDRWDIETDLGSGWEVESSYYDRKQAKEDFREYQIYVTQYGGSCRIKKRMEKRET